MTWDEVFIFCPDSVPTWKWVWIRMGSECKPQIWLVWSSPIEQPKLTLQKESNQKVSANNEKIWGGKNDKIFPLWEIFSTVGKHEANNSNALKSYIFKKSKYFISVSSKWSLQLFLSKHLKGRKQVFLRGSDHIQSSRSILWLIHKWFRNCNHNILFEKCSLVERYGIRFMKQGKKQPVSHRGGHSTRFAGARYRRPQRSRRTGRKGNRNARSRGRP